MVGRLLRVQGWLAPADPSHFPASQSVTVVDTVEGVYLSMNVQFWGVADYRFMREAVWNRLECLVDPQSRREIEQAPVLSEARDAALRAGVPMSAAERIYAARSVEQVRDILAAEVDPFGAEQAMHDFDKAYDSLCPPAGEGPLGVLQAFDRAVAEVTPVGLPQLQPIS